MQGVVILTISSTHPYMINSSCRIVNSSVTSALQSFPRPLLCLNRQLVCSAYQRDLVMCENRNSNRNESTCCRTCVQLSPPFRKENKHNFGMVHRAGVTLADRYNQWPFLVTRALTNQTGQQALRCYWRRA